MTRELPEGIEIHGKSLRVQFPYRGQRCRETLKGLKVNKANIAYAQKKRSAILYEIERGIFDYASHFPDSKKSRLFSSTRPDKRISQALDELLRLKGSTVASSTLNGYKSKTETHIRPRWGHLTFREVIQSDIDDWIVTDLGNLKNKTINEVLIIFRGIFAKAKKDKIITELPDLDNLATQFDDPDPFTRDEISKITGAKRHRSSELNCIVFDIWSGLRVSELIALGWDDIDTDNWEVHVCRARVDGQYKRPKTKTSIRTVELIEPAIQALKRQMEITAMLPPIPIEVMQVDNKSTSKELWRPVFINTNTKQPIPSDNYLRDRFLSYHLKKCKVRYRGPKHCRHTYASQMLTLGMPKEWIARQMGHSSVRTLEQHYAKWIKEDQLPLAAMASGLLGYGNDKIAPTVPQGNSNK